MDEYRDEFDQLPKYSPGMDPTVANRAWKFKRRLRPEIMDKMFEEWMSLRKAYEAVLR